MMDGRVAAIRKTLDDAGFQDTLIMSYAVKYASSFYAPFRDAVSSAPSFGDRKSYQMDPANLEEAVVEAELDLKEGADNHGETGPFLDVIRTLRDNFGAPIAATMSAEYSMLRAAIARLPYR